MTIKYVKLPQNKANGHKECLPNGHHKRFFKIPFKGPPKLIKRGLVGLKINYLTTMPWYHLERSTHLQIPPAT
jgi:hypothetical protein